MTGKQYGLIIPKKNALTNATKFQSRVLNPLRDSDDELERDGDEDEKATLNWIEASFKKSAGNAGQKCLQKRILKDAMKEDSTVFQYDEIYDEMKAAEEIQQQQKNHSIEKKPKYIGIILKHAEKRKLEKERRQERKVQKERDAEGEQFAEKESFVTSSYLKKLDEMKTAEEEERLERIMEESVDIHKHKNFGVFYNHLLKQRLRDEPVVEVKEEPVATSAVNSKDIQKKKCRKGYMCHEETSESSKDNLVRSKTYLKQNSVEKADQKSRCKNHAKYSNSIERKIVTDDEKNKVTSQEVKKRKRSLEGMSPIHEKGCEKQKFNDDERILHCKQELGNKTIQAMDIEERIHRYQSLFAKRTVGNAFKDAIKRYFERKAMLNN